MLKVSWCLSGCEAKRGCRLAWAIKGFQSISLRSNQGHQLENPPLIPLPFQRSSLTFSPRQKGKGLLLWMWAAAGPPSSIHHPACRVWNSCRCTRVFVCISECLRVMMLCQGLSDSSGRSLRHVVIQQKCKKHNLAPSFHPPTTPAPRKRKTKQNVHYVSVAGS